MTPSVFRAVATCVVPEAGGLDAAQWDEMAAIVARAIAARPRALQRQLALFFKLLEWLPLLRYILATGFGAALGPLEGLVQVDTKGFARRRDRVVSLDQPSLYFVGHNYDATGGLYNISRDARLAARLIGAELKGR